MQMEHCYKAEILCVIHLFLCIQTASVTGAPVIFKFKHQELQDIQINMFIAQM